jgi:choline dehydrogenase
VSDVLVIGGGTAGCIVATGLCERGALVTLVEAGPDYGHRNRGRWPDDLLDATSIPRSHDWGYSGHGRARQRLAFDRARVIGGCSSHNGSTHSIGSSSDWEADGFDVSAIDAAMQRVLHRSRVRTPGDDEVQPFQVAFVKACQHVGIARTDDLCDLDGGAGVSVSPVNIVDGVRWNMAFAYLDDVRDRVSVVQGMADIVIVEHGHGVGVRLDDGRELRADRIVVCAGAYGTPALLQRSGIGPAPWLQALGIHVVADLPVGDGLQDQPSFLVSAPATDELVRRLRAHPGFLPEEQCVAKVLAGSPHGPYDHHVYPWIEATGSGWQCVFAIALLRPRSRGEVRITSRNPAVAPLIDHRYLADPADLEALASGVEMLVQIASAAPFEGLTEAIGPTPGADEIITTHGHYWHPTSSTSIGPVLDQRCNVHGIDGLAVVDASTFPTIPRATTALPIAALAEWWASTS